MTAWIYASSQSFSVRFAVRTLDFLIDAVHHHGRHLRRCSTDTTATGGGEMPPAGAGGDFLSRFSEVASRFPKPTLTPYPEPGAKPQGPDHFHYNALMKAFAHAGDANEVLRLLRGMKESNCDPNVACYTTVADALVTAGRPEDAEKVFEEMVDSGVALDAAAYTVLVKLYSCCLRRFDSAHEVIRWMARCGCEPDVVTYSTLIAGLCGAGRVEEAWEVLYQMLERKCTPNPHTYTPILYAYCSSGRIDEAKWLLESMQTVGCSPDTVTYNVLIYGLCKIGDFHGVEHLLEGSALKGWEPDSVTYNTYIDGLCKMRQVEEAFRQLEVMLGKGLCPTTVTLNILLDGLCQDSKVWEVKSLLERSSEFGLAVDAVSYNTVMSRLCEAGTCLGVLKLFTDMIKKGIRPDRETFNIVIYSLCKVGKLRKAMCIFKSKGFIADIATCNILIHAFCVAGKINELYLLLSDMRVRKIVPDTITYNTLVDCLCRNGKYFEAIDFVRAVEDGFLLEPVAHLAFGLAWGGKFGELLRLFEDISERGLVLDGRIYDSLIKAFCRRGSCQRREIIKLCFILDRMLGME